MNSEYNLETMQINLQIKYLNNIINGCSKSNINYENVNPAKKNAIPSGSSDPTYQS